MIKLTELEKQIIDVLDHPVYTVEFIENRINGQIDILTNPVASLRLMGVIGYYEAVHQMAEPQRRTKTFEGIADAMADQWG